MWFFPFFLKAGVSPVWRALSISVHPFARLEPSSHGFCRGLLFVYCPRKKREETFKQQSQSWHEKEVEPCQGKKHHMPLALWFTSACKAPVLNWSAWLCNWNSNVSGVERWWFHTPSSLRNGKEPHRLGICYTIKKQVGSNQSLQGCESWAVEYLLLSAAKN